MEDNQELKLISENKLWSNMFLVKFDDFLTEEECALIKDVSIDLCNNRIVINMGLTPITFDKINYKLGENIGTIQIYFLNKRGETIYTLTRTDMKFSHISDIDLNYRLDRAIETKMIFEK